VTIAIVDAATDASAAWRTVLTTGFLHPDIIDGPPSHESFDQTTLERTWSFFETLPGVARVIARIGSEPAGGASLFIHHDVALLTGAATLPAFRRRGVQSGLLVSRLAMARDAGCRIAVVTTQPGSKSQQNVQRLGFDLIYSRAILVKTAIPAS
jgi:GNAT superfamily N-acetyltransferase